MAWTASDVDRILTKGLDRRSVCSIPRLLCVPLVILLSTQSVLADTDDTFFETAIRPLLAEHCWKCHGERKQWGDLRLDSRAALLRGGEHGPAIVEGRPEQSLLITAIRRQGELQMPPDDPLTDAQIASLERWIRQKALWPATDPTQQARSTEKHWAFQPLSDVEPPSIPDIAWNQNPIDRLIGARLLKEGLRPSSPADRRTLIRRLTYDLTGLPPTVAEVTAFVESTDPDAWHKLIERQLATPQYGEHWGRKWLDVARYSDTKGYVYGREERFWVHAAAYRDWVVKAFQQDLPYDRFLMLQIAADQLAPDDAEASAAMGFLTLGRRFLGVTPDIIDDRIDVVTRGTMGLSAACARCHDHKYDPIPTTDYYSLYSIFLNSREVLSAIDNPVTGDQAFDTEFAARLTKLRDTTAARRHEASERARSRVAAYLMAQPDLANLPPEGFDQVLGKDDVIPTFVRHWDEYLCSPERLNDPVFLPWVRLAKLPAENWAQLAESILNELKAESATRINPRIARELSPPPASFRELAERYGKVFDAVHKQWQHACETAQKSESPAPAALPHAADEAIRQVLYGPNSPCDVPDEAIISTEGFFDSATCDELWKLQDEVDRWLINSPQAPRHTVKLVDRDRHRPAFVFRRGNPKSKGDRCQPHFLSIVDRQGPQPFATGSGRLELAKAIVDPGNPLTARVWVNRIWQHHFGEGLVSTPSDFGVRADPPAHGELLDWLAREVMRQNWSTKAIHRLILTSQAYQQRSSGPDDPVQRSFALQKDPMNRLLWRMNTHRLTFEEMRDSLLVVSGRLNPQTGGRASDMFAGQGLAHQRRTLYGLVDRQFLASPLRIFDFANPDLHIPRRSDTVVPQQALFSLNHPLMAEIARSTIVRIRQSPTPTEPAAQIRALYRAIFQRDPTEQQLKRAIEFLREESKPSIERSRPESLAWSYGWGRLDEATQSLKGFAALPHFTGSAWQGGSAWPDQTLGWLQLTAEGGHTGNDLDHSVVRRWTAPRDGHYSIQSRAMHEEAAGDGVRFYIVASRGGILKSAALHNRSEDLNVDQLALNAGDTIDFIVDVNAVLNCDQHLWSPRILEQAGSDATTATVWDARRDFSGPTEPQLDPWQQLAQVLFMSNEFMFVD